MGGPVSSGYPGTLAMSLFACFAAFLLGRAVWFARKARQDITGQSNWRGHVSMAIGAGFLLGMALWALWAHRLA
jgi:L-alanine-DL-glutamate epimerase-like enolase superfamily enzyme